MTTLLKSPGIIMEPTDAQGSTPLHLAATYNQPEIAKTLLTDGNATPAARDEDQRNPLHEACQEGSTEVAKVLLEEAHKKFGQGGIQKPCRQRRGFLKKPCLSTRGRGSKTSKISSTWFMDAPLLN